MTKSYIAEEMGTNFEYKAGYATSNLDMLNDQKVQTGRLNHCRCPFKIKEINFLIQNEYLPMIDTYLKDTSDINMATKYAGVNLKYRYKYRRIPCFVSDATVCFFDLILSALRRNKSVTNSPLKMF